MNLIPQQVAYSSIVRPEGNIAPAWQDFLQRTVNSEAYEVWAKNSNSGYTLPVKAERRSFSLRKALIGILP